MRKADIVFCLDRGMLRPMLAAINSILANTATPARLRFSIMVPEGEDEALFAEAMQASYADVPFAWRVTGVRPSPAIWAYISGRFGLDPARPHYRGRHMTYSRLQMNQAFPDLGKVLYLDPDLVVLDDVVRLIDETPLTPERGFAAAPHLYTGLLYFRSPLAGLRQALSMMRPFNSGVFLADISLWDDAFHERLSRILDWDRQHDYKLFHLNDEPILNILFSDYMRLPARWNRCGYGNHPMIASLLSRSPEKCSIIHWSGGHRKPWKHHDIVHGDIWRRYAPPA